MRHINFIQVPRRRHPGLSDKPLAFLRANHHPFLELNSKATRLVTQGWKLDLTSQEALLQTWGLHLTSPNEKENRTDLPVGLSFNTMLKEITIRRLKNTIPDAPFTCNLTVMSSQRDQLKFSCAAFLRIPQVKYAWKYLAVNKSDFGVVSVQSEEEFIISLDPRCQAWPEMWGWFKELSGAESVKL